MPPQALLTLRFFVSLMIDFMEGHPALQTMEWK